MPRFFSVVGEWAPTGRCRPRVTLFGRVKLQVEETRKAGVAGDSPEIQWQGHQIRWRAARGDDLLPASPWQIAP